MRVSRFPQTGPINLRLTQVALVMALVSVQLLSAQTKITAPKNKYTPQQDVQLGREAAAQVEQQLPLMQDDNVTSFVNDIGRRLAQSIPAEMQNPEWTSTPISAFAVELMQRK